jgi:hypothetical protein
MKTLNIWSVVALIIGVVSLLINLQLSSSLKNTQESITKLEEHIKTLESKFDSANQINRILVVSANKRAIQTHSANVYKALVASLTVDTQATAASILTSYGGNPLDCSVAPPTTVSFGWNSAPKTVLGVGGSCKVVPSADGMDFTVIAAGDADSDNYTSTNGS